MLRILYIDDYVLDRELVRDALESDSSDFDLVEARNQEEFLDALSKGSFDLILTDFNVAGFEDKVFPGNDLRGSGDRAFSGSRQSFAIQAGGNGASVTEGRHHLVLHLKENKPLFSLSGSARHEVELFDLEADPDSITNLVEREEETAQRLRKDLIEWLLSAQDLGWVGDRIEDPELVRELERLGYVTPRASEQHQPWWVPDECSWCQKFR